MQQSKDAWEKEKKDWENREKTLTIELENVKKARTEVTQVAASSNIPASQSSFISQISQMPLLAQQQQQPILQSVGASQTPTELNLPKGWSIAQRVGKQEEIAKGWGVNQVEAHRNNLANVLPISRFNDSMRNNAKRFQ